MLEVRVAGGGGLITSTHLKEWQTLNLLIKLFNNWVSSKKGLHSCHITKMLRVIYSIVLNTVAFDWKCKNIQNWHFIQKFVFSLSFLWLQPKSLSPKTYCLSQFTYSLETSVLNRDTRDYLNICQNNILRQILGLQDIKVLERRFCLGIDAIFLECMSLKMTLKRSFNLRNGIIDSINTCFSKYKSNSYKSLLDNLIKPDFIREDEVFQELLHLIITGNLT